MTQTVTPPTREPQYASRTEHRAAIRSAPITIEITQRISVQTEVDVVGFFESLPLGERAVYFEEDISAQGYADYERPMVYLSRCLDADVMEPNVGSHAIARVDDDDREESVSRRDGAFASGEGRFWSLTDYEHLLTAVPWMRGEDDETLAAEDLARLPGPLDNPLF